MNLGSSLFPQAEDGVSVVRWTTCYEPTEPAGIICGRWGARGPVDLGFARTGAETLNLGSSPLPLRSKKEPDHLV